MEKKKEESVKHGHKHPAESKSASKDESDSDENEFEEFLDWRNKKWCKSICNAQMLNSWTIL